MYIYGTPYELEESAHFIYHRRQVMQIVRWGHHDLEMFFSEQPTSHVWLDWDLKAKTTLGCVLQTILEHILWQGTLSCWKMPLSLGYIVAIKGCSWFATMFRWVEHKSKYYPLVSVCSPGKWCMRTQPFTWLWCKMWCTMSWHFVIITSIILLRYVCHSIYSVGSRRWTTHCSPYTWVSLGDLWPCCWFTVDADYCIPRTLLLCYTFLF